ncbi:hypothetical protein DSECCO2_636230 [anaerobic digester metagenome]
MPDKNYIAYQCEECGAIFIMPRECVTHDENYLTCPKHGRHHRIKVVGAHDDLSKCMEHARYKRNCHGAMEQG